MPKLTITYHVEVITTNKTYKLTGNNSTYLNVTVITSLFTASDKSLCRISCALISSKTVIV